MPPPSWAVLSENEAIGDAQSSKVPDGTAFADGSAVAGEGAVGDGQICEIVYCAAVAVARAVVGESDVGDGQMSFVSDCARVAVGDRQVIQRERADSVLPSIETVAVDRNGLPNAVDGQSGAADAGKVAYQRDRAADAEVDGGVAHADGAVTAGSVGVALGVVDCLAQIAETVAGRGRGINKTVDGYRIGGRVQPGLGHNNGNRQDDGEQNDDEFQRRASRRRTPYPGEGLMADRTKPEIKRAHLASLIVRQSVRSRIATSGITSALPCESAARFLQQQQLRIITLLLCLTLTLMGSVILDSPADDPRIL